MKGSLTRGWARLPLSAAVAAALSLPAINSAAGVIWEDIVNDENSTHDVLMYGLGLKAQRYSPLKHIYADNVQHLTPAWSFSFGDEKQHDQELA